METSWSQYRANPDVICTELDDGEAVLLNIVTREYYTLNASGGKIWQCVADGLPMDDAIAALSAAYEVDRDLAEQYVRDYLDELSTEGLLLLEGPGVD
jgi:hypothetical protein